MLKLDKRIKKILSLFLPIFLLALLIYVPSKATYAATTTYQAESATIYQGVTETTNAGYTGTSYVNYNNVVGSYVEWNIDASTAGTASLEFTYANGNTADRPMEIKVNGTVISSSQSFVPTGAWTTWRIVSINVKLNAGKNVVRATATTTNGGPNVDKLDVNTSKLTNFKFDFGAGAAVSGYTKVSASQTYSSSLGYGFNTPANMSNVTATGTGVNADAVQFKTYGLTSTNTFNLDLPNGLYQMKVTLGNTSRASVIAEGAYQIMNMTGDCVSDSIQIPITDGQLNLLVSEGKTGTAFTLAALEISRISASTTMGKTIWIGGDSTACNYYPMATSVQTGWGQMLPSFINNITYQFRNMATAGQWARGFRDDGQFATVMKYIKPGDLFLLEYGINDTNTAHDETEAQFKEIMRDMVDQVKAKGATVVLVTPQGKVTDFDANGVHSAVNRWYRNSTVALATEESVPLVDLNVLSSAYFTSIGQTATTALYMADGLHFNHSGATELARLVYKDLIKQGLIQ